MLLFVLFFVALADDPGLRITLTSDGLSHVDSLLVPQLVDNIRGLDLKLPRIYNSSEVNITRVEVFNANLYEFVLLLDPSKGFKGSVGFSSELILNITYHVPLIGDYNTSFVSFLNSSNVDWSLQVGADASGTPQIVFDLIKFYNVSIDLGNTRLPHFIENLIDGIIEEYIERELPDKLNTQVNEAIKQAIAEKWDNGIVNIPIEAFGGNVTIDIALIPAPVFTAQYCSFSLKGTPTLEGFACTTPYPDLPPLNPTEDFQIEVNTGLFQCIGNEVKDAHLVDFIIKQQLAKRNITFDDRVILDIGLSMAPQLTWMPDLKVAIEVGLGIDIKRNTTQEVVHVLAVDLNASVVAHANLSLAYLNSSVTLNLTNYAVVGLGAPFVNKDAIPPVYYKQIANENWEALIDKINDLIKTNLGPEQSIFVELPPLYVDTLLTFVSNIRYSSGPAFLLIEADILPEPQK